MKTCATSVVMSVCRWEIAHLLMLYSRLVTVTALISDTKAVDAVTCHVAPGVSTASLA